MNPPAETHFTISPEEWMNLSKVALWHDYGDPGLLHNIIDEYADALISQRVAVVRPTRDQLADVLEGAHRFPTGKPWDMHYAMADALLVAFWPGSSEEATL